MLLSISNIRTFRLLTLLLVMTPVLPVAELRAQGNVAEASSSRVSLNFDRVKVSDVFREIHRQSGLEFVYSTREIRSVEPVSIHVSNVTVSKALETLFAGTQIKYRIQDKTITLWREQPAADAAAEQILSGVVRDSHGEPLPGVNVRFKSRNIGVITDVNGEYQLRVPRVMQGDLVVFSFMGMKTRELSPVGKTRLNVTLEEAVSEIGDVVVTGFMNMNRNEYVGAVTQIRGEDVHVDALNTIDEMLQGQVPGVSVVNTSGKLGASPKIRIRGTSTLLGNQNPLWVVDNVIQQDPLPIPDDNSPLSSEMDQLMETAGNAISWLNPNDIETITILKDAAATAIYGSQAANGVIVITTKKAKTPGLDINYSGQVSFTQAPSYGMYDMMNSQEHMAFCQSLYEDRTSYTFDILPIGYAGLIQLLQRKEITYDEFQKRFRQMEHYNTDWFDILFRTAVNQQHNVSLSTYSDKLSSRVSVGLSRQQGEAIGNDLTTVTASTNTTFRAGEKFDVSFSMNGSYRKSDNFAFNVSPYEYAMNTARDIPCWNEDDTYFYHEKKGPTSFSLPGKYYYNYNIINERQNTGALLNASTLQTSLSAHWRFLPGWEYQGDFSFSYAANNLKSWATEYSHYITQVRGYEYGEVTPNSAQQNASILPFGGLLQTSDAMTRSWSTRHSLVYTTHLAEKHNLTFNLGLQLNSNTMQSVVAARYGYLYFRGEAFADVPTDWTAAPGLNKNPRRLHQDMTNSSKIINTVSNQVSEYLTAVYSYDQRYVLNLNARMDASNRFGQDANHRFNPAFSAGLKWRIGNEPWMRWAQSWYDMFDISFSYGWRGNAVEAVSPYLIATDAGLHTYYNQYVLNIHSLPYPDLGWEKTNEWNLGLDFSFLNGRLSAGVSIYDRTSHVLASRQVPAEYGIENAYITGTTMGNSGYELTVSCSPIRTKDWTWSLSFNTSQTRNEIDNSQRVNSREDYISGSAIVTGEPYGTFYAYKFAGLSHNDGRPIIEFPEGNDWDVSNPLNYLVKAGSTIPDVQGGIGTTLRWRRLSFTTSLLISLGAEGWLPEFYATSGAPRPEQNVPRYMLNRWRRPGDELTTTIPSIPDGNPTKLYMYIPTGETMNPYAMYNRSNARVASRDYIRCRTISARYEFRRDWIKQHLHLSNMYVSASMTNPFFIAFDSAWDGRDPETSEWPQRRSYSLSLNVSF